ncbi:MAG: methionine adenosyltransferase [Candidatus Hadarchaeales archaeon]
MDLTIERLSGPSMEETDFEIVERKGLGHPDTICDLVLDRVSVELSREYLKRFGTVLHHNADKSLLVAGEAETRFGGGKVKKPMLFVFGDRATRRVGEEEVDVDGIVIRASKQWFKENLRFVDPERHLRYRVELKPGSAALVDLFRRVRKGEFLGANDTSAAVGYAPLSRLETLVLKTEKYLNSKDFKRRFPETGEDVKVMGIRRKKRVSLTIAMAFVDKFIKSEEDYFRRKEEVLEDLKDFLSRIGFGEVELALNTLDARGRGPDGVYLTVLGTSADGADSGEVGRGNRPNGVIPLNRPVSSEAAAGKNPVSHIGKIYNLFSHRLAEAIYERIEGLKEVYVWLVSQIGKPINEPQLVLVKAISGRGGFEDEVRETVEEEFSRLGEFCDRLIRGEIPIC